MVGTGTSDSVRGAPEPSRDIFVFRVEKETSMDAVSAYLTNNHVVVREIEQRSRDESLFNSFHVRIKVSDLDKVLNANFWPTGVNVRRYWPPKRQSVLQSWS